MRSRIEPLAVIGCGLWLWLAPVGLTHAAGDAGDAAEAALGRLWQAHMQAGDRHEAVIEACGRFEKTFPSSPFTVVVSSLAAWHLLKAGRNDDAERILRGLASLEEEPLARAGDEISRRWLTRLDRERVKVALREYYLRHIAYPQTLDQLKSLPASRQAPLTDRWGKPWSYRTVRLRHIAGVADQDYALRSVMLGEWSDLAEALKRPYAATIQLRPVKAVSVAADGQPVVMFESPRGSGVEQVLMTSGARAGDIIFAHAGGRLLLLSDGDYWLVLERPGN
jgi:hypothetical protein